MRVFSYLVSRDWGFAPNPFYGFCTLACCKPTIRRVAKVGDLIIGCGTKKNEQEGRLIFAMRVTEKMTFAEYWNDPRFRRKRPILGKSKLAFYGDNIYRPTAAGFEQLHSHHSLADGSVNAHNRDKDTGSNNVLVSEEYVYFGRSAPQVPAYLRDFDGIDLCPPTQGHISLKIFPEMRSSVEAYFNDLLGTKVRGLPTNW